MRLDRVTCMLRTIKYVKHDLSVGSWCSYSHCKPRDRAITPHDLPGDVTVTLGPGGPYLYSLLGFSSTVQGGVFLRASLFAPKYPSLSP